ncbi:MAG: hypothetical protein V4488_26125 [Pseudomonadota bacterium]
MKTAHSIKSGSILAIALFTAVFASGCAYHTANTAAYQQAATAEIQTVTMIAKRMSTDEKIAFDTQNASAQTVVIAAKRLTAEQKLAMLQEDLRIQASAARHHQPAA